MTKQFHAERGLDAGPANGPRILLADHHRGIEKAFKTLHAAVLADDCRNIVDEFRCFERAILEHVQAEEEVILPAYELFNPKDAAVIRADHARIRDQLTTAAIETELHKMRAARLTKLIETLRAHAAHEDRHMYPWAQVHLPLSQRQMLFLRLSKSLRSLLALDGR